MTDIVLQLTDQQYRYIAQCVAYGLNCFGPWPKREQQEKTFALMFGLTQDSYGSWEASFEEDED